MSRNAAPDSSRRRSLADWLRFQERQHPQAIALGLERVAGVARRLSLPAAIPGISIAGTNGKGSTATLIAALARAAGLRVGLYTSPHLLRYNERVRIDGIEASDEALCAAFEAIEAMRGDVPLTYFEYGTLAALWLFREARVELQVLEVGLGGRLDAVNLVDADVAVLTQVGLDHQDWLGDDREQIGREKAGIFRAGRPAVIVERAPPDAVLARLHELPARGRILGRDYDFVVHANGRWDWHGVACERRDLPPPAIPGDLQVQNAAGALAALEAFGLLAGLDDAALAATLQSLRLCGRGETHRGVVLDVAHNVEAAQGLVERLRAGGATRAIVIVGMLADKPVEGVVGVLARAGHRLLAVGLEGPRGLGAGDLAARAAAIGVTMPACTSMAEALSAARGQSASSAPVVVTGSFLTVAAALRELDEHG